MKSVKNYLLLLFTLSLSFSLSAQKGIYDVRLSKNGAPAFLKSSKDASKYNISQSKQFFQEALQLEASDDLKEIKATNDNLGFTHKKFQQYHKGIKVEFATYSLHAKNGNIEMANGEFRRLKNIPTKAKFSEQAALNKALSHVGATKYKWQTDTNYKPKGELVIVKNYYAKTKEDDRHMLAYKFDIYAEKPLSRDHIYVSAETGQIILVNPIIKHCHAFHKHSNGCTDDLEVTETKQEDIYSEARSFIANATGTAYTRYSGTQTIITDSYSGGYRLRDNSRGNGINTYDMNTSTNYSSAVDFVDSNNTWSEWDNAAKDNGALDAHWGAEMTYDYFLQKHNRNSFNGSGAAINSYVHYDSNYDNAFWDGQRMTYGDGSGTYFDILTSLDVAAHEIGHAVCTYTANLVYSYESGAMNEGFSDIWGACVEYYAAPNKQTWLIGEDIERRSTSQALRSMSNPNSEGQPDTYQGTSWYSGSGDNGGVHYNSGVLNYWFYLLTVGGSSTNDNGDAFNVTGIGIEDAAKIAYRLESVYLSANSQYSDARTYGIQAAEDLFGAGSTQVESTTNAWYAVGIGAAYNGGGSGGGGGGSSSYCATDGTNASYEWISSVSVGSFSNSSGSSTYSDYTSQTANLTAGSAASVSLTPAFSGSTYTEYWKIWIDYNNDYDFDDAGEEVYSSGGSSSTVTGSFTPPASAAGTTTRMRITMKYNGQPTSCETFSYGEIEDYTVTFGGSAPATCDTPTGVNASSVAETTFTIGWNAVSGASSYDLQVRASGGTWSSFTGITGTSQGVTGATAGTTYEARVRANCSNGATSSYSSIISLTTDSSAPATCATPSGLVESGVTETDFTLSWNAVTGATSYDVQVRVSGGTWSDFTAITATSQAFNGATAGTLYDARVRANCSNGATSSYSSVITFSTNSSGGGGGGGCSSVTIDSNDFETTWGIWNDGGSDCAAVNGYANSGTGSIRLRDNTSSSVMTTDNLNLSSYAEITVAFSYITNSMDNANEDFWLQVSTDGGSSFTTVEEWNKGDEFENGIRYNESVTITGTFSSTTQIRFRCDASANGDQVYIDDVVLSGCATTLAPVVPVLTTSNNILTETDKAITFEVENINVYPNPARDIVNIAYNVTEAGDVNIRIINIEGKVITNQRLTHDTDGAYTYNLTTNEFQSGTYFVQFISTEGEINTKRLVILK